jgi:hypothetical protein
MASAVRSADECAHVEWSLDSAHDAETMALHRGDFGLVWDP